MSPTTVKGAPFPPSISPSAAASFMGWCRAICTPEPSPVKATANAATKPTVAPTFMLARANFFSRFFHKYQQLIPTTNAAPTTQPLVTAWKNFITAIGDRATAAKSLISFLTVAGLNVMPTGCCIQALATRIHHAEIVAPKPVSHVAARWNFFPTLFQPKNITATNVDSMKNATMASMANGAPKISPTNWE